MHNDNNENQIKFKEPVGAVMIIGGGISGMQSALDLANADFKVYLVEDSPAVGGRMAQLDKTFPTNDCSMCIVSPKLVELGRHRNIELLTYSEIISLEGESGNFIATIKQHPRYVDLNKCTGCGQCEIVCPVTHKPYFPAKPAKELKPVKVKSKHQVLLNYKEELLQQASFAWIFSVDQEKCKKCGICFRRCPVAAISWVKGEIAQIDPDACISCGTCYVACPTKFDAIQITNSPKLSRSISAAVLDRSTRLKEQHANDHDVDCLRCGLCQIMCDKVIGASAIQVTTNGLEVKKDICMVCGACVNTCPVGFLKIENMGDREPVPLLSMFNEKLSPKKPIDIKYPQAVPRVPVIDETNCVKLNTGGCGTCQSHCDAKAIQYDQVESIKQFEIGSLILSPGYEVFDAKKRAEFGYGIYPNVLTSLEFERLLSASGPTSGTVKRPSDQKHPKKIAWIQCVGSRDVTCSRDYCSSVCCMYATKEAVIAREHDNSIEATIFYIDLRAFGKGFDDYVERAKNHHGVRFVRSMVSRIYENPQTHDLELRYISEDGKQISEIFDTVVLSVGLQISEKTKALAAKLGVETDKFGFAKTDTWTPLATNIPGIFVSGVFNGPKDIPETVIEASAAATAAAVNLHSARGTLIESETFPLAKEYNGKDPRIGVFICHCGINISSVVDVAAVTEFVQTDPNVVFADHPLYTCSQDSQQRMKELIDQHQLSHIVVAACSPRTHEPVFQETMRQAGLNHYMFDMANIRDQCSWVHQNSPVEATEKAKRLVLMAIANVKQAEALKDHQFDVDSHLLIIGGGVAGIMASLQAAKQGFGVFLVEKNNRLGGHLNQLKHSVDGGRVKPFLNNLIRQVREQSDIHVFLNSEIISHTGFIGNFETEIMTPAGVSRVVKHGATVVATGGFESRPDIFGLNEYENVVAQTDLETLIEDTPTKLYDILHIVMIQCAGSRDMNYLEYCSRVCCNQAVKNALKIKKEFPAIRIDILYRDMRTYGHGELNYREARKAGVNFIRYDNQTNPIEFTYSTKEMKVKIVDPSIRRKVTLAPDLLVLSTGIEAADTDELASMLRVTRNANGFFLEAHAKLRPVDFASEGLFLAGTAHGPKNISETISQASAAVARAATVLSKSKLSISGVVSKVDAEHCAVCLTCVRACPYDVPFINAEHTAEINPALCQGCGICVAECPAKAISLGRYRDENIFAKLEAYEVASMPMKGLVHNE